MSSKTYWKEREAEQLRHYITDEKEYDKQLERIYNDMLYNIQKEIESFYGKYAKQEGITITEAKKRVAKVDIEAYERKAKKYVKDAAKDRKTNGGKTNKKGYYFSEKANEEMRLYNLTMKVNRLEMLKANIGLELVKGHSELEEFMEDILQGRTEDELKRQAGILGETIKNNAKAAEAIVNASFHNATFSDRIWMHQDLLKSEISKLLQTGLIQGKNPRVLARELQKKFDVKTSDAERLMRTELARVQTEAQKQSFIRNGFDMYEFICNHNGNTCDICRELNGKHFEVVKMMPGENAPPMHPNCRCSTAAWEDSEEYEAWLDFLDKGGTTEEWEASKKTKVVVELKQNTTKSSDDIEKTSKGSTIELADINKMNTLYEKKVLDKVPKKEGYFDFAAHGSANSIEYETKDKVLTAREVARIIKHHKTYKGEKIRLLSCSTGSTEEGFAQQLANALGVEVEAPTDVLLIYPDGKVKVGYDGSGEMKTFKPKGR